MKKRLKGIVISDKMQKTVVVRVERIKKHPKYLKRFAVHKKYKAHDEKESAKMGDTIIIEECRPISKDKKWKVAEVIREDKEGTGDKGVEEDKDKGVFNKNKGNIGKGTTLRVRLMRDKKGTRR